MLSLIKYLQTQLTPNKSSFISLRIYFWQRVQRYSVQVGDRMASQYKHVTARHLSSLLWQKVAILSTLQSYDLFHQQILSS